MGTKELIMDALIELMQSHHLNKIYVKDIAKKANITRQSFYRHFKDKYDVINWYYDINIESLFLSSCSIDGIRKNLVIKCDFYKKHKIFFQHAYKCNTQNSLTEHEYSRIYKSLSNKIYENTGIAEKSQSHELSYSLSFFIHGLLQLTIDWLYASCPISSEAFADMIINLMPEEISSRLQEYD